MRAGDGVGVGHEPAQASDAGADASDHDGDDGDDDGGADIGRDVVVSVGGDGMLEPARPAHPDRK